MNAITRAATTAAVAMSLGGCQTMAMLNHHEMSDSGTKERVVLAPLPQSDAAAQKASYTLPTNVAKACGADYEKPKPRPGDEAAMIGIPLFSAVAVPLIGAGINLAASETQKAIDERIARYGQSYETRLSVDGAAPPECLLLAREVQVSKDYQPAFRLVAQLIKSSDKSAFRLQPVYAELSRSKARTGPEGQIDVEVSIKAEALTAGEKEAGKTVLDDKIVLSLTLPNDKGEGSVYMGEALKAPDGRWFPALPGSKPMTYTVTVKESGLGKENFERIKAVYADAKDGVVTALKDAVKKAMTEEQK